VTRDGKSAALVAPPAVESVAERLASAEALLRTDPSRVIELAGEILADVQDPRESASALLLVGAAQYQRGQSNEAREAVLSARDAFEELDESAGVLRSLLALVRLERDLGECEAAASNCDQALVLSRSLQDPAAEADALYLRASVWNVVGEYAKALECLEDALTHATEHRLDERRANILNNLGSIYIGLGDQANALESLTTAYEVLHTVAPGTRTETANLVELGTLYAEMGDTAAAREFLLKAREVGRKGQDFMVEAAALNNLANTYTTSGEWITARDLFQEALDISRRLEMRQYEIDNLDGLGQVHAALGEHEQALDAHLKVLEIAREINDREGEIESLLNLGREYTATERFTLAFGFLHEGLSLARQIEHKHSIYRAHQLLSEAYEQSGDAVTALHHYQEFYRAEKAVFNEESAQQTRRLAVKFDLERARHEAEQYRLRVEVTQAAREEAEAEVRERTRELEEAQLEIVTRLAVAAEYRDDATGEHTKRVGRNAAAIARALEWPEDDVDLIFTAARLHDVGKIGIGDNVLLKPGKLDPDEFELIRAHTTIGARILSGGHSRLLRLAEEIALSHHERWDGKGYPFGLAAEAIPVSARIVAVADVLDALTHSRPYKQAWSVVEALAEIERQAGRHFDPRVVAACLEVFGSSGGLSPLDTAYDFSSSLRSGRVKAQVRRDLPGVIDRFEKMLAQRTRELEEARLEAEASVQRMEEMAFSDPLTGLGNRRAFDSALEIESARAQRSGDSISVLTVDMDALKLVNDTEGHEYGDKLLSNFAAALRKQLREFGRVYRVGGDEFAAILVHVGTRDFPGVLRRVEVAARSVQDAGFIFTGVSAGLAAMPEEATAQQELARLSDQRMYRNKVARRAEPETPGDKN
jgi:diguanylate cyclase (GGDEF)-like protein